MPFLAVALLLAGGATAQHAHPPGSGSYAALASREIKALSTEETEALRAGRGMMQALPAELNGYPGPMHTLEHAQALALSAEQRVATEALMTRHKGEARRLGAAVIDAERALEQAFARREADAPRIRTLVAEVARLRGELRASHLLAHVEQTRLLSAGQTEQYQRLRGYARN
ncbi:MAG: hypothetical protein H0W40_12835 [Methylibium sp.]|nr:hypothetical protein [Methylibium sp.]